MKEVNEKGEEEEKEEEEEEEEEEGKKSKTRIKTQKISPCFKQANSLEG